MADRGPALTSGSDGRRRCFWGASSPEYERYHDEEWGRPVSDDRALYERMVLEGFQSGLSWITILRKRENFRSAFAGFEIEKVARFNERDVRRLLKDAGIVRHRGKIEAAINNAEAAAAMHANGESLGELVWSHKPKGRRRAPRTIDDLPPATPESTALAKELKRRGFRFVGPTTVYATMQACGIVNDHLAGCYVRAEVARELATHRYPHAGDG
jgi:DNA-3-methyladenine glycosylase I